MLSHRSLALLPLLALVQGPPADLPRKPIAADGLAARMADEAKAGFSGVVLLVREGEVVFEEAYGLADRAKKLALRPDTIFAIGSTPIDFTRAGVLLLAQEGSVELADPLANFFPEAPADKRAITLAQLMNGRSGLVDFVDQPTDADPDHTWIEREEFLARVFATQLLFPPGQRDEHSHAAFGVLAAVIEEVAGTSFRAFCEQKLYAPAGMVDTGWFGEEIPSERLALGYGPKKDGTINAPPLWGPTSWLVMGSGGQTSTLRDLLRWHQALRAEKILTKEWLPRYYQVADGILNGGDMYGFEIWYTTGARAQMFVVSNSAENRARRLSIEALALDLADFVRAK